MFKKVMSVIIWPILAYSLFVLLEFVTALTLDDDILTVAKQDTAAFILLFFGIFVFFITISVLALFFNHRYFEIKGTYDGASAVLNLITTFTSVTTLVVQFAGGEVPKGFLTLTLGTILLAMALSITSHLLKWQQSRDIRKRVQKKSKNTTTNV